MSDVKSPLRLDAAESAFFTRQLEYIKAKSYDEKLAPLNYAQFLPVSGEAPLGATNITWRSYKGFGLAKIISDYAKDFPRTDIGGEEHSIKLKDIGVSFGYSIQEIRRAQFGGLDLEQRKANNARRAVEQKINSLAWVGDATHGIQGFIKYPGTTEYTVPATGTSTTKTWSTKTAAQILTDLNGIKNAVYIGTNGVEMIDTILLPMAQFDLIKNTLIGTSSDTTVYEFFVRNNPGITIAAVRELDGAGTAGADMFIAYKNDSDHLSFELPLAFEQFEAEREGMEYTIPCHAICAGTLVYYPQSISWGEGI
jgi:hypothetical protein